MGEGEKSKALVPVQQKQVEFYGDKIMAVLVEKGRQEMIYVPLRHMCDLLGVSYQGQIRRIKEDAVLARKLAGVNITFTPDPETGGGGTQIVNCIPLSYLNGWLFGINARRVKEEVRERLILYQEKCYEVLAEAFQEGRLTADPDLEALLHSGQSEAAQAYRMLQGLLKLARNQVIMEAQLQAAVSRVDAHDIQLVEHTERLEEIESMLGSPEQLVRPEQAMQISQAVKAVAHELGKRSGRNEYGGVYGELYRRYGINSYKALPQKQFENALSWLNEWLQSLIDGTPF
jgi:hypothetical protein